MPKNLPSPPTYPQGQPGGLADPAAVGDIEITLPLPPRLATPLDAQLAQQISQIAGVAQVNIGGQQKPSIRVQVDPAKLVAKGLSLEDVRAQIAITTVDSPKGNIDGERRAYTIYANDQLLDSKDWNDVIIAYRNGGPLRIRDVGQAVTGPEDAKQAAWANGKRGKVFLLVVTTSSPAPTRHRDRGQDQVAAAEAGWRRSRRRSRSRSSAIAPRPFAPPSRTFSTR